MNQFKFDKVSYEIEKDVLDEFNSRFSEIKSDVFLVEGIKNKVVSLKRDKKDFLENCEEGEKYPIEKEIFATEKYENKIKKYQEFVYWVKNHHDKKTILGLVFCPYTHEVIETNFFPGPFFLSKPGFSIDFGWKSTTLYKISPADLFKRGSNSVPLRNMSKKALDLFFSYWSYDVLNKVSLSEAKDENLLKVDSERGSLYYGNGDETWNNQLYYSQKGFFVKMKSKRIFIPCHSYKNLEEDLRVLARGGQPLSNPDRLPTTDERINNAIAFGVLDPRLAPKKDSEKQLVIKQIKKWVDDIQEDSDIIDVYAKIQEVMKK